MVWDMCEYSYVNEQLHAYGTVQWGWEVHTAYMHTINAQQLGCGWEEAWIWDIISDMV